ncbi:T9SS type A sorting domain-containing protein [Zunongwangia endophytica]|uniref:T9SS type A sorting domain-containing protein n=1 Tax=Zunongwangia endophytica TaxID=1808945 RepID=UPI0025B3DD05|nr:T9SS type A sorting domain-containing protein [Zunongwangia endophytica]MDN3594611.1 T9SS type A sorting domain-containing protein [Zunongwangia endophytica]
MKHYYIILALIFPIFMHAQNEKNKTDLSVSPSKNGEDNYVYVKNELLFVNGAIELNKNNSKETEASIYLREDAQLLQGLDTKNKGKGYLSVFQEGTSNSFDYDYWGMPVETNGKTLDQVLFEPATNTLSNPVRLTNGPNGSASPLTISTRWIYKLSGVGYKSWDPIGKQINKLQPGMGFTMKGTNGKNTVTVNGVKNNPGSQQRYDFRGIPNNGDIIVNVNENNTILVGNPYPSTIDLNAFLKDPDNDITGIAYFWDSKENGNSHYVKDYEGGYGAYSPGANDYVPATFKKYKNQTGKEVENSGGALGLEYERRYAPIGQGFTVVGTKNGGKLTFKNSYRVDERGINLKTRTKSSYGNGKNKNSSVIIDEEKPYKVRLNISLNDTYTRQLLVAFKDEATKGADKAMDAPMFGKLTSDAAWNIDGREYMINVLPFDRSAMLPLNILTTSEMEVDFFIAETEFLGNENIYLYDSENERFTDIKEDHYKVQVNGESKDRFFLAFQNDQPTEEEKVQETKEEEIFVASIDVFQNNNEGRLQVKIPQDVEVNHITIFNLNGGAVVSKNLSTSEKEFSFTTANFRDAIYIVQLNTSDNRSVTKKITVKN